MTSMKGRRTAQDTSSDASSCKGGEEEGGGKRGREGESECECFWVHGRVDNRLKRMNDGTRRFSGRWVLFGTQGEGEREGGRTITVCKEPPPPKKSSTGVFFSVKKGPSFPPFRSRLSLFYSPVNDGEPPAATWSDRCWLPHPSLAWHPDTVCRPLPHLKH